MSELRIRIKLGNHEIELEGTAPAVKDTIETLKQILAPDPPAEVKAVDKDKEARDNENALLGKVIRLKDRQYYLAKPMRARDAILLILLAYRFYRPNHSISGMDIMNGLRLSGIDVPRADHIMVGHVRGGLVIASGQHRRRRYRLSLDGVARAQQIARALAAELSQPATQTAQAAASG